MTKSTDSITSQQSDVSTKKIRLEEMIENDDDLQQIPIRTRNESRIDRRKAMVAACVERLSKPKSFPSIQERYAEAYRGRTKSSTEIRTITDRLFLNNTKFSKFPNNLAEKSAFKTTKQIQDINENFHEDLSRLEAFTSQALRKGFSYGVLGW